MRGEFVGVWPETWREIWGNLADHADAPLDIFCELFRELSKELRIPLSIGALADIVDDPGQSEEAFKDIKGEDFTGERGAVVFLESIHDVLYDLGGDPLANHYFNLLTTFVEKYSLRYELRRPCTLCPTLPGVFTGMIRDLRIALGRDVHLDSLMKDFESAVWDLRIDSSETRIKTCIQKQINLLEAMGRGYPGVRSNSLGRICNEVGTWPHESIKDAMKSIYHFTCDYPGIRHGGTHSSAIRAIDMRDMVAMSILLAGFVPYLTDQLDADSVYRGT